MNRDVMETSAGPVRRIDTVIIGGGQAGLVDDAGFNRIGRITGVDAGRPVGATESTST